jgi:hypothetical protein
MKRKQVWRYYCDFCGKGGCSASSMSQHEKHCTMNPKRDCRMCEIAGNYQQPMAELIALIPKNHFDFNDAVLTALRDATENCPACILAVLRQSGITATYAGFRYDEECKQFWADINERESREEFREDVSYELQCLGE